MENAEGAKKEDKNKKKRLIKIPSYNPTPPPPSFFSQASSFLKSSKFYTPPTPQPHLSSPPETTPRTPTLQSSTLGPNPPPTSDSSSSGPASSSLSHGNSFAQNRNAILVNHKQKGNQLLKHIRNVRWVFADIVCDYLLGKSSCALYIRTDIVTLGSSFGSLSRIMDASMEELACCPGIGERKVRRLYDTFHEPFRQESSCPSIALPGTPVEGKGSNELSLATDDVQALKEDIEASELKNNLV